MENITTIKEFKELLNVLDFQDISGFNILPINLEGTFIKLKFFKHCSFNEVYFKNTKLEQNIFTYCDFNYSNFESANIQYSVFRYCDFNNCNFLGSIFQKSEFFNCTFNNTKFYKEDKEDIIFFNSKQDYEFLTKNKDNYLQTKVNIIKAEQEIEYTSEGNEDFKFTILYDEHYYSYYDYNNLFPGQWGTYLISYKIDQYNRNVIAAII